MFEVYDENRVVSEILLLVFNRFSTVALVFSIQTRDDFLGLVEINLNTVSIATETDTTTIEPRDYILRPRRLVAEVLLAKT